ncbi:hypothetical protein ACFL3X_01760, partial [Gemmatimonadota bacterium]
MKTNQTILWLLAVTICACGGGNSDAPDAAVEEIIPITLHKSDDAKYSIQLSNSIGSESDSLTLFGNISDIEVVNGTI